MDSYIDIKYLNLISPQLQQFKKKGDFLWNFRCPYCGDSQKSRTKARGFVYRKKNDLFFKCHNCAYGTNLSNLIKHVDANLHKEYTLERYKEGYTANGRGGNVANPIFNIPKPVFKKKGVLSNLKSFRELGSEHPAYKFIEHRKLPESSIADIYLCNKFYEWTNSLVPNKFSGVTLNSDHPRMIIPFRNSKGEVFAYQGRAFGKEKPKYITIILDEDEQKIFGMDRVDWSNDVMVVEGPIDSLFLENGIAVAQSDLRLPKYKEKVVLVPDNEPRNAQVCAQLERCIEDGYRVVIWPDYIKQKDINDMFLSGISLVEIRKVIHSNTFQDLEAKVNYQNWKRI
jgi:transcription elongation factor Elf1